MPFDTFLQQDRTLEVDDPFPFLQQEGFIEGVLFFSKDSTPEVDSLTM